MTGFIIVILEMIYRGLHLGTVVDVAAPSGKQEVFLCGIGMSVGVLSKYSDRRHGFVGEVNWQR